MICTCAAHLSLCCATMRIMYVSKSHAGDSSCGFDPINLGNPIVYFEGAQGFFLLKMLYFLSECVFYPNNVDPDEMLGYACWFSLFVKVPCRGFHYSNRHTS